MPIKEFDLKEKYSLLIKETVLELAEKYGYKFNRVFIKNQKTRLGSCSSNMNLNFNWQICKFPKPAMEYVIKHELAHLVHQNHKMEFWKEVEKLDPNYKDHHAWIKLNAHKYLKFGKIK
ncbi:hypothetical protein CO058_00875 [candidate division WWE3 bacterium CG_4_9_14_0_2_um_filter_35_11]|uniref:YgjP-like metallopeptidase domain-containing protein n=1 Tax=candidate division WWE3 bacterium CG_4_9_14_0_2_um_filter_35_11 TaxID=1975077 RepID=A0A2M8EMJ7_UNCKA|nr:MAG: hypothetical protein COV25_00645 [candidate division WWE3 bacterium CG10_big_fil_rev_8_21_14_0_10_35_32]PJC23948.1 MAG: hypothetical protein CO058_00875 [candidate division WWE3 bacterium CG_4_9_14_0_2_um_filter_35_11]